MLFGFNYLFKLTLNIMNSCFGCIMCVFENFKTIKSDNNNDDDDNNNNNNNNNDKYGSNRPRTNNDIPIPVTPRLKIHKTNSFLNMKNDIHQQQQQQQQQQQHQRRSTQELFEISSVESSDAITENTKHISIIHSSKKPVVDHIQLYLTHILEALRICHHLKSTPTFSLIKENVKEGSFYFTLNEDIDIYETQWIAYVLQTKMSNDYYYQEHNQFVMYSLGIFGISYHHYSIQSQEISFVGMEEELFFPKTFYHQMNELFPGMINTWTEVNFDDVRISIVLFSWFTVISHLLCNIDMDALLNTPCTFGTKSKQIYFISAIPPSSSSNHSKTQLYTMTTKELCDMVLQCQHKLTTIFDLEKDEKEYFFLFQKSETTIFSQNILDLVRNKLGNILKTQNQQPFYSHVHNHSEKINISTYYDKIYHKIHKLLYLLALIE